MFAVVLVILSVTVFLLPSLLTKLRNSNPPPGTHYNLPESGPSSKSKQLSTLSKWAVKYGKIYTLHIPGRRIVVLNDINIIQYVLGRRAAVGTPGERPEPMNMLFWSGEYGAGATSGYEWFEQKQFLVKTLGKFGFGRAGRMKELVLGQAEKLCERIASGIELGKGNKMVFNDVVDQCTANIMWSMITGRRMEENECTKFVGLIDEFMTLPNYKRAIMSLFKNIAPEYSGYKRATDLCEEIQKYIERQFKENERTIIRGKLPRDMIDVYIKKVRKCQDYWSTFFGESGKKHSYSAALGIMIEGTETTGAILTWILFYLSVHGQVQKKLQQEIDSVIGKDREPDLEDKAKMPYMEAVTLEALRFSSIVPLAGSTRLLKDVSFDGYLLPLGTDVVANLYFVDNDKKIWGDPEKFRPERFLGDDNLKEFIIAFQMGKRKCPGEHFAKDIIFLIVAKLFQTFDFDVDPSITNTTDYLETAPGVVRKAKKFALVVTHRDTVTVQ